jgi:hypothetical protein
MAKTAELRSFHLCGRSSWRREHSNMVTYIQRSGAGRDHSYEEIRNAALDILAKRETASYQPNQYVHLRIGVAEVLDRRDSGSGSQSGNRPSLTSGDSALFQEIFWDLFRQGVITLGLDDANDKYPFFRVSSFGERMLAHQDAYFFHDVSTYTKVIEDEIPAIDETTLTYLQEAMQAFKSGCILSSSVMIGVASEHTFDLLMQTIDGNPAFDKTFVAVRKENSMLRRVTKFREIMEKKELAGLPHDLREDFDTNVGGIQALIRNFRNESGHPTGKIISREQQYVNLNLFVPYAKRMYQLMNHYRLP